MRKVRFWLLRIYEKSELFEETEDENPHEERPLWLGRMPLVEVNAALMPEQVSTRRTNMKFPGWTHN